MPAIITDKYRMENSKDFISSFVSSNYFMYIGRTKPWVATTNYPTASDTNPPISEDSVENIITEWREMVGAKVINQIDTSLSVPRNDWQSGIVYTPYDSSDSELFLKQFYVLTTDLNCYKCIANNGGIASSVEPTGTGTALITTADGYIWKYMYSVSAADAVNFLTPQHQPVAVSPANGSPQATVQDNAVDGSILSYRVLDGGAGYTTASATVVGDGAAASVNVNVSGGQVVGIDPATFGDGYTYADIVITGDGTGAVAAANISPKGGHGFNAPEELGAYYVTISKDFQYGEGGDISTDNDFRTIGIVRNPEEYGTANLFVAPTSRQTTKLDYINEIGVFERDEVVTGSVSGATGQVVDIDTAGEMYLNNVKGQFAPGDSISGETSGSTADVQTVTDPEMEPFSGSIFYVEQRKPIYRDSDQIESVRVTIEF